VGWYLIPPEEFSDRLHAISTTNITLNGSIYDDPAFASQWWNEKGPLSIIHTLNPARADYFDKVLSKALLHKTAPILEVGCGGGLLTLSLVKKGYNVTGLDLSKESLHAAKRQAEKLGASVHFKSGTVYDIPAADASFDGVIITEVTEKLLDLQLAFKEISRVLKPGGVVVFDTINRTWKSWLIVANLMESAAVNSGFPKGFHDWRLFVKPDELESLLAQHRLSGREFVGLYPTWNLPSLEGIPQGMVKVEITGFEKTELLDLFYMGYAINEAHVKE